MEITYSDELGLESGAYSVQASVTEGVLTVGLLGADEQGEVHTDGQLRLPIAAVLDVHLVLRKVFDGLRQLDLMQQEPLSKQQRTMPANNGQPWTEEADQRLVEDWIRASPQIKATEQVKELARVRDRTAGSIRSRLLRLGCDPDQPGARLLQGPDAPDTEDQTVPPSTQFLLLRPTGGY